MIDPSMGPFAPMFEHSRYLSFLSGFTSSWRNRLVNEIS